MPEAETKRPGRAAAADDSVSEPRDAARGQGAKKGGRRRRRRARRIARAVRRAVRAAVQDALSASPVRRRAQRPQKARRRRGLGRQRALKRRLRKLEAKISGHGGRAGRAAGNR